MQTNLKVQVAVEAQHFTFSLCRKAEQMGPASIDHWWMKVTELYAQRGQRRWRCGNYQAAVGCFWALCKQAGSAAERDVQESYLLARLLPEARNQGSRVVFADACLASRSHARGTRVLEEAANLDAMIRGSRDCTLSRVEFRDRTADVLGPPPLSEEAVAEYRAFTSELLSPACEALGRGEAAGLKLARERWGGWMRSIGRRAGNAVQKQVLDVLSYECRAALHRCYSAAWCELLPVLERSYQLTAESKRFLEFWHLEPCSEAAEGDAFFFHLFHGHVFALHPASGELLRTAAGREVLGRWLTHPDEASFGRLLHALYVAALHYAGRKEQAALERRKQPTLAGGPELVGLEERLAARRTGRRGVGRRGGRRAD
jgi:hypothetical protein